MTTPGTAFVATTGSARSWWCLGTRATLHVGREQSAGLFTLIEVQAAPGFAAPRHVHRLEDETLLLRGGALQVHCGDTTWRAGPGATVFLPQRVPHSFTVVSGEPLVAWQITAPAGYEDLLASLGQPAPGPGLPPPPDADIGQLADIAGAHGIDFLPWLQQEESQ